MIEIVHIYIILVLVVAIGLAMIYTNHELHKHDSRYK